MARAAQQEPIPGQDSLLCSVHRRLPGRPARRGRALPRRAALSQRRAADGRPGGGDALLAAGRRQADPARCSRWPPRGAIGREPARACSRWPPRIELIHTYSLIHDDLPAMDDDDLRRGRPTCHVEFGEDVAILAGDAPLRRGVPPPAGRAGGRAARACSPPRASWPAATGVDGMVGGQYLDVAERRDTPRRCARLHELKTGRLIGASVVCVLLLAGMRRSRDSAYRRFAAELGVLFQIVDDILDVTGTDDGARQAPGQRRAPRASARTSASSGSTGARDWPRESPRGAPRAALRAAAPHGARRARADHRLHPHPDALTP